MTAKLEKKALACFLAARSRTGEVFGKTDWWPRAVQSERTLLAWALALAWADEDLGARAGIRVAANWGGRAKPAIVNPKRKLLEAHGVRVPRRGAKAARSLDPHEVLVDFAIWRRAKPVAPVLTMESEMSPNHALGAEPIPANGFAYDFLKLLLVPSPRRLFACAVRTAAERDELLVSLRRLLARAPRRLRRKGDVLRIYVVLTGKELRHESIVACAKGRRRLGAAQPLLPP